MKRAFFLTLEGPDGCGKSTQAKRLVSRLKSYGVSVLHTREPGGGLFSEKIRNITLDPQIKISPLAELLLFEAARVQHVQDILMPALKKYALVLCERYYDSTIAYQGYGRKMNLSLIQRLNQEATMGLNPDLTIVLDLPSETGLMRARKIKSGKSRDRMEDEALSFHQRVRNGYRAIAKKESHRVCLVSAVGSESIVEERLWEVLQSKLQKKYPKFFSNVFVEREKK